MDDKPQEFWDKISEIVTTYRFELARQAALKTDREIMDTAKPEIKHLTIEGDTHTFLTEYKGFIANCVLQFPDTISLTGDEQAAFREVVATGLEVASEKYKIAFDGASAMIADCEHWLEFKIIYTHGIKQVGLLLSLPLWHQTKRNRADLIRSIIISETS